MLAFSQLLSAP